MTRRRTNRFDPSLAVGSSALGAVAGLVFGAFGFSPEMLASSAVIFAASVQYGSHLGEARGPLEAVTPLKLRIAYAAISVASSFLRVAADLLLRRGRGYHRGRDSVAVNDANNGYWRENGEYCPLIPFVGQTGIADDCRAAFLYPEPLPGGATRATLWLELDQFHSSDSTECVSVHPVLPDHWPSTGPSVAAYLDAGSPVFALGGRCFTAGDVGEVLPVELEGMDAYFPPGQPIALGLTLTTLDGSTNQVGWEGLRFGFGNPDAFANHLVLEQAAPSSPVLTTLALGAAGVLCLLRLSKRKAR